VTSSTTSAGLAIGNFITVPAGTGQTVRITNVVGTAVTVYPAIVAANTTATFSYAGTWTNYTGTTALGTAFQYVKAKITAAQATRNAGLVTITAPGGTGTVITITNYTGNATTTVTGTVASTSGWATGDKITIAGATGTEQVKLNGTWTITVLTGTTFSFVVTTAVATGALTTTLGTTTKNTVVVTGAVGTLFTKTFKVGDVITIPNTALGVDYTIASITSDTVLSATIASGVTMPVYSTATTYAYKGTDLYKLTSLGVKLDAKQKSESGMVVALSTDTAGTIVNFSSSFIDIVSINLASQGTTAVTCVYNFSDTNPTGTYTVSGTTTCTVNVTAHGLVASNQLAYVTFTSGTAPSGRYLITYVNANQFTITLPAALTTSGSVSVYPNSMTVYAFNDAGTRISIPSPGVSWTVRGF
jgi:hypothetical protein